MKRYKRYNHAKTLLRYHLIFSTKYRKKCLEPIRENVLETFTLAEKGQKFKILLAELDKDHVHFLLEISPDTSISEVVKRLKQFSTYYIWKTQREHMKKFYWSKKHHLWTRGYFASTIGEVSEEKVLNYIKNQG